MDISFVLTHDCNLGCAYCYTGAKFRKVMPESIAKKGLDMAFQSSKDSIQLSYFGGEPLLELPLLLHIADEAILRAESAKIHLQQTVTTNGTLLTPAALDELYARNIYVALSIDGVSTVHDQQRPTMGGQSSFSSVHKALQTLVQAGRSFETISVVTPLLARHLGESVSWLFQQGTPRLGLNPCYEVPWSDEDLTAWEQGIQEAANAMIREFRTGRTVSISIFDNKILAALKGGLDDGDKCKLGDGFVAISPDGFLYPCERLVAEDDNVQERVGHVDTGIVWDRVCNLRPDVSADHHAINNECIDCAERFRCSASCACANKAETGNLQTAGGVQCWHEQTTARIADSMAETLFSELNTVFFEWYYGRMGVNVPWLLERLRSGEIPMPDLTPKTLLHAVPRKNKNGKRVLNVL